MTGVNLIKLSPVLLFRLFGAIALFCLHLQIVLGQAGLKEFCNNLEQAKKTKANNAVPVQAPTPDVVDLYWKRQKKYFLVITATRLPNATSDKEFAAVDGNVLASKFCSLGYVQLGTLIDAAAHRTAITTSLEKVRTAVEQENSIVVVYYSGHGVVDTDNQDLRLQVSNETPSEHAGIPIGEVVKIARSKTAKGTLVLIIDSCYSGQGTVLESLPYRKLKKTIIVTSSGENEPSYSMDIGDNKRASAFSYFFTQAVSDDWETSDKNNDGILTYEELWYYETIQLKCAAAHAKIKDKMSPDGHPPYSKEIVAYNPAKARVFDTDVWRLITIREIERRQAEEILGAPLEELDPPQPQLTCPQPITPTSTPTPTPTSPQVSSERPFNDLLSSNVFRSSINNSSAEPEKLSVGWQSIGYRLFATGTTEVDSVKHLSAFQTNVRKVQEPKEALVKQPTGQSQETQVRSVDVAALIRDDADVYALGLKAVAEKRHEDARTFLLAAEQQKKTDPFKIYLARGRNEVYAGRYLDAVEWYKKALGAGQSVSPLTLIEVGNALRLAGKYEEAQETLKRAISEIDKSDVPSLRGRRAITLYNLAQVYEAQGRYDNAEEMYGSALKGLASLGPEHTYVVQVQNDLASLYIAKGQYDKALVLLYQASAILEKDKDATQTRAGVLTNIGTVYTNLGNYVEAEASIRKALNIYEQTFGPTHPSLAPSFLNLAILYDRQKQYDKAETFYQRALEIQEKNLGASHVEIAVTLGHYAQTLRSMGRESDAQKVEMRAKSIRKK